MRPRGPLLVAVAVALVIATGCDAPESEAVAPEPEATDEIVTLDPVHAAQLVTAVAEAEAAPSEVAALGRVLDPVPLLQAWGGLSTARRAAAVAERELARVRTLAENAENASARDLEAASLAASQAEAALAEARAQASGVWGSADVVRLAPFAKGLAHGSVAIARIELPAGAAAPKPRSVRVSSPGLGIAEREAELLGPAGAMDPTLQGPAFLVALRPDPPPPGAVLAARLELDAEPQTGVYLPESAVVWHAGVPLAFVTASPERFERRALSLARPWREGFLVSAGVAPGEKFVVAGAQQLLSSQLVGGSRAE